MSDHQHEPWQLHADPEGQPFCAACGHRLPIDHEVVKQRLRDDLVKVYSQWQNYGQFLLKLTFPDGQPRIEYHRPWQAHSPAQGLHQPIPSTFTPDGQQPVNSRTRSLIHLLQAQKSGHSLKFRHNPIEYGKDWRDHVPPRNTFNITNRQGTP